MNRLWLSRSAVRAVRAPKDEGRPAPSLLALTSRVLSFDRGAALSVSRDPSKALLLGG